jgi:DNA ligase (NAD+)
MKLLPIRYLAPILAALFLAFVSSAAEPAELRAQLVALRAEVARHDALYFQKAAPEISDRQYDELKRRLREFERAHPALAAELGGVPDVADDRTGLFPGRVHRERMLGLEKARTERELRAFHTRLAKALGSSELQYVVEPKVDGLAISVTYENGRIVSAVTRGNGSEGDDVTANLGLIRGLPTTLAPVAADGMTNVIPAIVELRGEVYLSLAEFQRINREREAADEPGFANPRNLAAGTLRKRDAQAGGRRELDIVFFGIGACEPATTRPATQRELRDQLQRWGLPVLDQVWPARGFDAMWQAVQAVGQARAAIGYALDGAVVKLDGLAQRREVGTSDAAPRWAIAYKFDAPAAETEVRAITIQVGRTGLLTPVAELKPVEIGGSTVARATLHNRDEIERLDLRVGDFVLVEKANDVIPAIVSVNQARRRSSSQPYVFPLECPACATAVVHHPSAVAVRCPNYDCPAQVRRRLEHFVSREAVGIEGLGPATIDDLVSRGRIKDVADLYDLTVADFSAGTGSRVWAAIASSRRAEPWRFIHGLGMPRIGAVAAKEMAVRVRSLAGLLTVEAGMDANSGAVAEYLADSSKRAIVERLVAAVGPQATASEQDSPLRGKVFVLTGALPTFTRVEATQRIEAAGGRVVDGVSNATDYVVVGKDPGSKLEQARIRKIEILDEAGLRRLLEAAE